MLAGGWGNRGVIAIRVQDFFLEDESAVKLTVVMVAQLCEYT